jgi:hypothetical protein
MRLTAIPFCAVIARMKFPIFVLLLASMLVVVHRAEAQVFTGPSASASGGAGRAAVDLGESSFLNPAGIAFIQRYIASVYAGVGKNQGEGDSSVLAASLADATLDSLIPGSLTYVRRKTDAIGGVSDTQSDIAVTIAGFVHRKFAIGVTGHRITDQILSATSGVEYNQYNATIGALFVPVPFLGIGVVAYDIAPGDSTPVGIHVVPTYAIAGNFVYQKFFDVRLDLVRPDTNNPGQRMNVNLGLETFFQEFFVFRVGGFWRETADQDYFTAGIGYKGPKVSVDYSFQKDVRSGENGRHLVDLWMPL